MRSILRWAHLSPKSINIRSHQHCLRAVKHRKFRSNWLWLLGTKRRKEPCEPGGFPSGRHRGDEPNRAEARAEGLPGSDGDFRRLGRDFVDRNRRRRRRNSGLDALRADESCVAEW